MKITTGPERGPLYIGFGLVAAAFIGGGAYAHIQMNALSARIDSLSSRVDALATTTASSTLALQAAINQTGSSFSAALQQNVGAIQSQVGNLSGSLTTLQKLSTLDPELLKKYSKAYFLNENYVPKRFYLLSVE